MAYRAKNKIINNDKKYIWHPFTQMADWLKDVPSAPLVISKGKGVYLYDERGKKYIDGVSSLWVNVHGHRHPKIDKALKSQIDKISHTTFLGLTHKGAVEFSEKLVKILPRSLKKVFFSDNGSTSVEVALKMAYQYSVQKSGGAQKNSFLSLKNSYHGDTIGSVSVGGMSLFHKKFKKLLFKAYHAPNPDCCNCRFRKKGYEVFSKREKNFYTHTQKMGCRGECIKEFEKILSKNSKKIIANIVEPMVQGAGGMIVMPPGYLKSIEKLCRKFNVLLICDEVATGFGKTGKMFAIEHENVKPDFICLSKGITGGYLPLACTVTTDRIYKAFLGKYEEFKTFFHGHTYTANPLACASALANLEIFKKENTLQKLQPKIKHLSSELKKLKNLKNVEEIRQFGFMVGVEVVKNKETKVSFEAKDKIGAKICIKARDYGLIIRNLSDTIVIMPPLSITHLEITKMVNALKKAIKETLKNV